MIKIKITVLRVTIKHIENRLIQDNVHASQNLYKLKNNLYVDIILVKRGTHKDTVPHAPLQDNKMVRHANAYLTTII